MLELSLVTALSLNHMAHSWYPQECCSDRDCAPVEDVEVVEGGYRTQGLFVPSGRARPSLDARYHLCRYHNYVICFFVPLNG
jgi:hypothetical protein